MITGKRLARLGKIAGIGLLAFCLTATIQPTAQAHKFNMSYLYFGNTQSFIEDVNGTKNSLHTVSPSYFDLSDDGTLDTSRLSATFVREMHNRNIKVVPFLSNHWDQEKGRKALKNKEAFVKQLVDAIEKNNLDGVNVDFENLNETDREDYTAFMKLLSEQIPEEKEVSVAVAANPYGLKKGWQGSYDFESLAKYSDYLMIMAYDESYPGSAPGPVAGLPFVEKTIRDALSKAPADKLVLGISFNGRYWQDGKTKGGFGIPAYKVSELVDRYNGIVHFDEKSKSPYATFTIRSKDPVSMVHGRKLGPGSYTVWFDNEESIKYKLRLVQKYNLLGSGSWSLTEAQSNTWDYYSAWLNGEHYFIDAEEHWAEQDILSVYKKGWMIGISDTHFYPEKPLTRAQGTVTLVRALGLSVPAQGQSGEKAAFIDVGKGYWAAKEIEIAYRNGLIKGIEPGKFAPDQTLTREQTAVLLSRAYKYNKGVQAVAPFKDVKPTHWAYKDIAALAQQNIFKGSRDGKFHPLDKVTRAQMAALMNRIAEDTQNR
jgi:spore germination protein YaaH